MSPTVTTILAGFVGAAVALYMVRQCRKPSGLLGRLIVWTMNRSHAPLTAWALRYVSIGERDTVLDVGCGGGRTVQRLSALARNGKVFGVDYSAASVAASRRLNAGSGNVEIYQGSASKLPLTSATVDVVTAVETFYYWPDRPAAMREVLRVLKPGGTFMIIAEAYRGQRFGSVNLLGLKLIGGACLTVEEHRGFFEQAGYDDVQVNVESSKGWLCAMGRSPGGASRG